MVAKLPTAFLERMSRLLGPEYPAFLASYEEPRAYGLRVNTLKTDTAAFQSLSPFGLEPVSWCPEGFYFEERERPGKHPYYHAGLYYIQEPSAMAPVELLDIQPGDRVLDLCAAPGGKSTQIAAKLQGTGLLVANDLHAERIKALVKNIELAGVRGAVVLNERPERLMRAFAGFFTKILIDAPCSGEGMFRKEEEMAAEWKRTSVHVYTDMQRDILQHAASMVAPGGTMVYSTCTFAPEENERMIAEFTDRNPEFEVVPVEPRFGFSHGRADWAAEYERAGAKDNGKDGTGGGLSQAAIEATSGTVRLWPHRVRGEGHFAAVLRKKGNPLEAPDSLGVMSTRNRVEERTTGGISHSSKSSRSSAQSARLERGSRHGGQSAASPDMGLWERFCAEQLTVQPQGVPVLFGEHLYLSPGGMPDLSGIRVIRPGWYVGAFRKNRFEPSHALAMGLRADEALRSLRLPADSLALYRFLKGETLEVTEEALIRHDPAVPFKGHCLVCAGDHPVGWGKWQDGLLKNEYPPGWRWNG